MSSANTNMEKQPGSARQRRRRPALACEPCRRRKLRCDRAAPCNQCSRSKKAICVYTAVDRPSALAPPVPTPSRSSASPERQSFASSTHATSPEAPSSSWPVPVCPPSAKPSPVPDARHSLLQRVIQLEHRLEGSSVTKPAVHANAGSSSEVQGDLEVELSFNKSRLLGPTHWLISAPQFHRVLTLAYAVERDEESEIHILLDSCKSYAKFLKQQMIPSSLPSDFRTLVPVRATADQLCSAYFRTYETVFRVLHVPTFQKEYNEYWNNPASASNAFVIQMLLVLSIGSCFCHDQSNSSFLYLSATRCVYVAQWWLTSPFEKHRMNLMGIQNQCLLLLARQACAVDGDLAWVSAGGLVRTAMLMGLHRDPKHLPPMPFFYAQLRRRLWATILEILLQSSMDSGGPPLISENDYDCQPPSNIDDVQMAEGMEEGTYSDRVNIEKFTPTTIQIELFRLFPIRLKVLKYLYDLTSRPNFKKTIELHTGLQAGLRPLSKILGGKSCSDFQVNLVNFFNHRFVLGLHLPFAAKSKLNPTYYFSRKSSIDTAIFFLSAISPTNREAKTDFYQLLLSGGGLFRTILRMSGLTICFELILQVEENYSSLIPESSAVSYNQLRNILQQYVDQLKARLAFKETNPKSSGLMICLAAQIDAMRQGKSVEQELIQKTKEVAMECHAILKARAEDPSLGLTPSYITPESTRGGVEGHDGKYTWGDLFMTEIGSNINSLDSWLGLDWESYDPMMESF